ncbi:T9SS type A sorting domain-containing protein [Flavobacterium sp.]|uniref:T9SS type A sorting domain-containing protein n=1 Tax=Flavobacterium sp. TaxID=239 RepID=UPI00404778F9
MVRNGGAAWAGTWLGLENNLDFSTLNAIKMDVWTEAPIGTEVAFKVEGNGGVHKQLITTTTVTGAWETLSWDFTGEPADYYKLVLLFDLGNVGDGTATSTFLFDNIVQYNTATASVKDFEIDGLMAYPNPTNGEWKISTNNQEIEAIHIFNVLGTKVISLNPNATSVNVDASSLTPGVYLATITTAEGTSSRKLIKEL